MGALLPSPLAIERAMVRQAVIERTSTGAARRRAARNLIARLTAPQLALHNDKARQQAALCTRQAGKTYWSVAELLYTALTVPRSLSVYINESRNECLRVVWDNQEAKGLFPMIEECLESEGLKVGAGGSGADVEINKTYLTLDFKETRARIQLIGADDERAVRKLRGPAYDLVICDESQKTPHLKKLAEDALFPGLMAKRGKIVLTGTPGEIPAGMFFQVTRDDGDALPGWSVHRFSLTDNIHIPDRFDVIREIQESNGWTDDNPTLLREYFGKWISDPKLLVYRLLATPKSRRYYDHELDPQVDWHYLIGCDIGFHPKPWAYVIWAFSEEEDVLYEVESASIAGLNTEQQATILSELVDHYVPDRLVCDAQGGGLKQIVEGDYVGRYGLPAEAAEKKEKDAAIEAFNTDLEAGRIKLREGGALDREMQTLPWFAPNGELHPHRRRLEDPKFPNHCCDAALYSYRCSSFYAVGDRGPRAPRAGTPEAIAEKVRLHQERLRAQARSRANPRAREDGEWVDERWEDEDLDIVDEPAPQSYYTTYGWGKR